MSIEKFKIDFISEEERLLFYEALVAYNKDCFNAAIALFSEALELNAENAETYRHRATCYCRVAEFKNAYFDFIEAYRLDKSSEFLRLTIKTIERKLSQDGGAEKGSRSIFQSDQPLYYHYNRGNYEEAICLCSHAIAKEPAPHLFFMRAKSKHKLNLTADAMADYEAALQLDPCVEYLFGKAMAYFDSKNFTEAESCFMNIMNPFVVKTTCRFTQSALVDLIRFANYKLDITRYLMDKEEDAINDLLGFLWEEPGTNLEYFYHEVASLILEDIAHSDVIGDEAIFKYGFAL